jgi:hypothetical protein
MNGATRLRHVEVDFFLADGAAGVVRDDPDRRAQGFFLVFFQKCVQAAVQRFAMDDTVEFEELVGGVVGVEEEDVGAVEGCVHRGSCGDVDILEKAVEVYAEAVEHVEERYAGYLLR